MMCPDCGKDLGEGSEVDLCRIGWVCSHDSYDIKIYKEMYNYIYESPDEGKTVYRRKFGDYDNRE